MAEKEYGEISFSLPFLFMLKPAEYQEIKQTASGLTEIEFLDEWNSQPRNQWTTTKEQTNNEYFNISWAQLFYIL